MIAFEAASPLFQGLTGLFAVLLLLFCALLVIQKIFHRHWHGIPGLILIGFVLYLIFQCVCEIRSHTVYTALMQAVTDTSGRLPALLWSGLLLVIAVLEILFFRQNRKWQNSHITPFSVKEAMDNLPLGLCCYEETGKIIMKNRIMDQICRSCTGESLLNAVSFRDLIRSEQERTETGVIVKLPDNSVYSVEDAVFSAKDPSLHFMTAADITELYRKTRTLSAQQSLVMRLNEELISYGKQIVASTTAREILEAKVKLHDELGSNLLAAKRYILYGGTAMDRAVIENTLRKNLQYLKQKNQHTAHDEYAIIAETAQKLDIRLHVLGNLTEQEPQRHIIVTGIHECLTNTIRHAGGDELTVKLEEKNGVLLAEFSNNGNPPAGPLAERGGLALLRTLTEKSGGTMQITAQPRFLLVLRLPKEG